jgi:hypothetical protein
MLNCHYCEHYRAGKCSASQPYINLYRQVQDPTLQALITDCPDYTEANSETVYVTLSKRDALLLLWGYIPERVTASLGKTLNPTAEMVNVSSSNIKADGFDIASQTLYVDFHTGSRYAYESVSPEMYNEFLVAPSIGSFFNHNIKGCYQSQRQF